MKGNRRKIYLADVNTSSNELDEQNIDNSAARLTTAQRGASNANDKPDSPVELIDHHSQEEQQQVGLLASEGRGDSRTTISTRLSALVPNIMVKSHFQKGFDSNSVPTQETRNTTTTTTTSARAMKKMLRDDNNSAGSRQSGVAGDIESNEKRQKRSISGKCCILVITLMALALIATVVFFLQSAKVLDNEPHCLGQGGAQHNYNLFSTKTLYNTALRYISKTPIPTSLPLSLENPNQPNSYHQNENYDKSSITVTSEFTKVPQTLEQIHSKLKSDNCVLKEHYFIGRHAARTPDSDDIRKITEHINNIKNRISKVQGSMQNDQPSPLTQLGEPVVNKVEATNSSSTCLNPLDKLTRWDGFVAESDGNIVTKVGFQESEEIGRRLKNLYPELFDGAQTDIDFATTDEIRTAQTAISFQKSMENFSNKACKLEDFPETNTEGQNIRDNKCYRKFIETYKKDNLKFHKECNSLRSKSPTKKDLGLTNTAFTDFIRESVSNKLSLSGENMLTHEETRAIYDVCRYESGFHYNTSIWCHLFKDTDLMFYEYIADALDFHNEAYGHPNQYKSACALTQGIRTSFSRYLKTTEQIKSEKPKAHFYFTHSSVIQKLIAASLDLEYDPAYEPETIQKALAAGKAPETRLWQTSLMSPFSANIAFSLYHCNVAVRQDDEFVISNLRLVASLNEQPIQLSGCPDHICELVEAKRASRLLKDSEECDLGKICKTNYVVT